MKLRYDIVELIIFFRKNMAKELAISNNKMMSVQATAYTQSCNIQIVGDIINRQQYDGIAGTYSPDFAIRPCTMFPACYLADPDDPNETPTCNHKLDSFKWSEVTTGGVVTVATSEQSTVKSGYAAVIEGNDKGTLYVKTNSQLGVPRTMRFEGSWIDPVSGYKYTFIQNKALYLEDCTNARAEINLDSPPTVQWNPLRHVSEKTLTARIIVGEKDKTADAKTKIWWYRILNDGSRQLISSGNDAEDFEVKSVTKGANGQISAITIDCDMIGDDIGYEVRACYIYEGSLPSSPRDDDPRVATKIVRDIPQLRADFLGSNYQLNEDTGFVTCQAVVSDNNGIIDSSVWNKILRAKWVKVTFGTQTTNGVTSVTESLATLGYGVSMQVPFEAKKAIRLIIEDRGAYNLLADDSGNILVDDGGNYIISREIDEGS